MYYGYFLYHGRDSSKRIEKEQPDQKELRVSQTQILNNIFFHIWNVYVIMEDFAFVFVMETPSSR